MDLGLSTERAQRSEWDTATQDEPDGVEPDREEYLDGQEKDSFPASDPHSDWSGPPPERD